MLVSCFACVILMLKFCRVHTINTSDMLRREAITDLSRSHLTPWLPPCASPESSCHATVLISSLSVLISFLTVGCTSGGRDSPYHLYVAYLKPHHCLGRWSISILHADGFLRKIFWINECLNEKMGQRQKTSWSLAQVVLRQKLCFDLFTFISFTKKTENYSPHESDRSFISSTHCVPVPCWGWEEEPQCSEHFRPHSFGVWLPNWRFH